ncbi:MAG: DNA polymerase III subunit delta [Oligoflexales bacterium]|nr:DNA polymerase III subunit delta [Oligoflexales bacterium]
MQKAQQTYKDYIKSLFDINSRDDVTQIPRLVALFGPSDYLMERTIRHLREKWLKKENSSFTAVESSSLADESFNQMWELESIFEPHCLNVIRRCGDSGDLPKLLSLIPGPRSLRNHIVICIPSKSPAQKLQRELERLECFFIPCFEPNQFELPAFLTGLGKKYGIALDPSASRLLIEALGEDLYKLENEIIKLSLIFHDCQKSLCSEDIAQSIGMLREEHAFKLESLLLSFKSEQALALLNDLLKKRDAALPVLGVIASHIRKSMNVVSWLQNGATEEEIASKMRLPAKVAKNYVSYVKRSKSTKFFELTDKCLKADIMLKSSKIHHDLVIQDLFMDLIG